MSRKFAITPDIERQVAAQFRQRALTIFVVDSACAVVSRILAREANVSCGRETLLDATKTGSLHAVDYGAVYTDNESDRGGAVRKAWNVNTLEAFAHVHAARIIASRQQRAAILNANKPTFTTVSGLSPVKR